MSTVLFLKTILVRIPENFLTSAHPSYLGIVFGLLPKLPAHNWGQAVGSQAA